MVGRQVTRRESIGFIVLGLAGILVAGPLGWLLGNQKGRTDTRVEAVKAGHARHVIVDDLGNTKFEWMPDPKKPEAPKQP